MKVMMWIVMALVLVADLAQAQDETKPDEAPVVFTPTIEKADELPAYVEPEPYDPNDQRLVDILLWVAGAAAVILVVVMLLLKLVRRMKKAKVPGSDTQQCPACKKQWKKYDFLPLPRIAVPRRVINIGNAQLVLLEVEEPQNVEVCGPCLEVGITLARVARERIYEKRAMQRRQELENLVEEQRTMVDQIHKIRFPSNGDDA